MWSELWHGESWDLLSGKYTLPMTGIWVEMHLSKWIQYSFHQRVERVAKSISGFCN